MIQRRAGFVNGAQGWRDSLAEKTTLYVVLAIGAGLRVAHYLSAGSLWHDEACLALNIIERNFFELLRPLSYDQAAPVGYLWLEKGISLIFGSSEPALRATSLLASLAVLALLAALSERLFGRWCAIVAVALVAVSPLWIYYAAEMKPYPLDAALALWVMLSFEKLSRDGEPARAEWNRLFRKAGLALLLSQSIVVILLSIGGVLAFAEGGRYRRQALALMAMSLAVAGGLYLALYRIEANGLFLKHYWNPNELSIWAPGLKIRLIDTIYNVFFRSMDSISRYVHTAGVLLLATAGLVLAVVRSGLLRTAGLVVPFVLLLWASSAGAYPLAPRTILFALPLLIMLVALPVAFVSEWASSWRAVWALAAGLLVLSFSVRGMQLARAELSRSFPRSSKQAIAAYESSGNCDPIYVFASSVPVWEYYAGAKQRSPFPPADLLRDITERNHKRVFAAAEAAPGALTIQRDGCRALIVGELPPEESQVLARYDWAAAEMRRIAGTGAKHIYVFGELFAPTALSSLSKQAAKCGGAEKTLLGEGGRGYLGELVFPNGSSCH